MVEMGAPAIALPKQPMVQKENPKDMSQNLPIKLQSEFWLEWNLGRNFYPIEEYNQYSDISSYLYCLILANHNIVAHTLANRNGLSRVFTNTISVGIGLQCNCDSDLFR